MTSQQERTRPDRNLALELVRVTEAAALAAARMVGRGDKEGADQAAVDAMRYVLDSVSMDGMVVIGHSAGAWGALALAGEDPKSIASIIANKLERSSRDTEDAIIEHPNLRGPGYFH